MKVLRKIANAIIKAVTSREEIQMGELDFTTGKVTW